jgi:putative NADH-flavin reductase
MFGFIKGGSFLNILILGGTGRVGSQIVSYALYDRHHVTVLVRNPEKVQINNENLTIIQGNVLNKEDIVHAMHGMDVVISALNTDGATILSESMPFIIEAMEYEGTQRIITIGTAGILQSRITPNLLRYQSSESKRKSVRAAEEHHKIYDMLKQSNLEWTIVCPTYLPDGERLGNYRTESNFFPEGGIKISVQDTAEFAFSQIKSKDYIKTRVGITY